MPRNHLAASIVFASILIGCSPAEREPPIVDVPSIARKSSAQVEEILGPPSSIGTKEVDDRKYPKFEYRSGDIEVVYINFKADRITIHGEGQLPYNRKILSALGLPWKEPQVATILQIRWLDIAGLLSVNVFPDQRGNTHYVEIVAGPEPPTAAALGLGMMMLALPAVALLVLPWLVALARSHHRTGMIFVAGVLLGWTVIGWLYALWLAASKTGPPATKEPASETKACPFCAEEILSAAIKCKHCGEMLGE